MVTIPDWFIRYGLPAGFLLVATVALLFARHAIHDGDGARVLRPPPRSAPARIEPHERVAGVRASAYSVRSGDTLATIAERFGTTVDRLLTLNPGIDPHALRVGQTVRVE